MTGDEASKIAAEAMRKYTNGGVSKEFMAKSQWYTEEDKFTFIFSLADLSRAKEATLPKGVKVGLTGWIKPPKPILTIYIDKQTGETFIRRQVKQYPWEQAA